MKEVEFGVNEVSEIIPNDESVSILENETKEQKIVEPEIKLGYVVGGKLNLRKKPIATSDVIKVLNNGEELKILSEKNNAFYKVSIDGLEGYCMKKFIKKVK